MLADKLLAVFVGDEVLTLREIADRSGYGDSTVVCTMSALARDRRCWRVAHGRYSMSPRKRDAEFTLKDQVLKAFRAFSFTTTRYVTAQTGICSSQVASLAKQLVKEGKLHKIRRGVYSAEDRVMSDYEKAVKGVNGAMGACYED